MTNLPLVNLWNKRTLVFHFSKLEIKRRYKESYLGYVWAALEPLLIFVLLYVVFTSIRDTKTEHFAIYLIVGVMMYHLFVRGTMGGLNSLRSNAFILNSLNIRKEFFPVVSTGTISLLTLVEVAIFLILMPIFDFVPSWTLVFFPILLVLLLLLILGFSYILSIVYVYLTDIQPLWGVLVYAALFASPIFWYLNDVPEGILLEIHKVNPLGQLIELGHKIVFGEIPPLEEWVFASSFVFGILLIGYVIFKKFEVRVAEVL